MGGASTDLTNIAAGGIAWNAGATLLGPLFNFNKNISRVDLRSAQAQEALNRYDYTVLQAFGEVENSLISIQTLKQELKSREVQKIAAMNAEMLSNLRYDKGVTSYLEVLESQRASFNAQLALSKVKRELLSAYIKFYKALGGGWISPKEESDANNNK